MASKISSGCCPVAWALACARLVRRAVCVAPGSTLFTVMPNGATSVAQVLAQFATAPRTVLDTPRPASGALTDVLITEAVSVVGEAVEHLKKKSVSQSVRFTPRVRSFIASLRSERVLRGFFFFRNVYLLDKTPHRRTS